MRSATLDFRRSLKPHADNATRRNIWDALQKWKLQEEICATTKDNAAVIVSDMKLPNVNVSTEILAPRLLGVLKIWGTEHLVNLSSKRCMSVVHYQVDKICSCINYLR